MPCSPLPASARPAPAKPPSAAKSPPLCIRDSIGCFTSPSPPAASWTCIKTIGWELGLPLERNRAPAFCTIRSEVTRLTLEAKQRPALIVDAAHLRNQVLEDLRLLTNYQMDSENRLCLLLVGVTELRRRLAMAVHESLL